MPVRGGNNGKQEGKHKILGLSADDAPAEVPPDVEVGWSCGGVELRNEVGSGVDDPRKRAVNTGVEMSEVPPDSSEDDMNDRLMSEVVPP